MRVHLVSLFYILEKSCLNRHRPHKLIRNLLSWNPTLKEGGLLSKVVLKHEHSIYVDPVASTPMGGTIVQELGNVVATLFTLHVL